MVPGGDGGHADGVGPPGAASRITNIHLAQDGGTIKNCFEQWRYQ